MRVQLAAIAALVVLNAASDAGCRKAVSERYYSVCLQLPTPADNEQAKRGIDWWGETVRYECEPGSILVLQSDPLPQAPFAFGWFDGARIGWIRGPIYTVVRHEFGHALGYADSNYPGSAMYSGAVPEELEP